MKIFGSNDSEYGADGLIDPQFWSGKIECKSNLLSMGQSSFEKEKGVYMLGWTRILSFPHRPATYCAHLSESERLIKHWLIDQYSYWFKNC